MAWICGSICFHAQVSPCDDEVSRRNWEANELIEKDRLAELKVIKILLLGGPESGKSTIFKQMRILHMNGFSDAERTNYKYLIYSNVFQAVHQIIMGAKTLNIDYEEETKVVVFFDI
uniref:Uncharacterized protein n=1 Tax=Acrobeloides nanus TaxID=290746 RepID=A0A914DP04_9BILA